MKIKHCFLCDNNSGNNEKLSFFVFPTDESRREEWLTLCNVDRQKLKKSSHLCHRHFSEEDICGTDKRRVLKRNAIPKLHLSKKRKLLEEPALVADIEDVRKIVSEKEPDLLPFLNERAASASVFEEVLRERTGKKSPPVSSTCEEKKHIPKTQVDNTSVLNDRAALSTPFKEISRCTREKIPQESAPSSLVERHSIDEEHIPQTQPDNASVLDERSALSSPFQEVSSEQIWAKIPHKSAISNPDEIHLHDERISNMQPDNVYLLDEGAAPLTLSSQKIDNTIHSKSVISGLVGVNSEENEPWELSMTLSEYIKQKDKALEEMRETIQRLENELKDKSPYVPLAETPTRNEDSDRKLLFRYPGDIGTPHCETPKRALRGIRILRAAMQHERSSKKVLQEKFRRAQRKIDNLNGVIDELRNANLISETLYTNMMVN